MSKHGTCRFQRTRAHGFFWPEPCWFTFEKRACFCFSCGPRSIFSTSEKQFVVCVQHLILLSLFLSVPNQRTIFAKHLGPRAPRSKRNTESAISLFSVQGRYKARFLAYQRRTIQRGKHTHTQTNKQGTHIHTHTYTKETNNQPTTQTYKKHTSKQASKQTNRNTHIHTHTNREPHTQGTHTHTHVRTGDMQPQTHK